MAPADADNPYADYFVEQLYEFLSTYELTRDIGSQYEYSNLGAGLLGDLLSRQAGISYEALLKRKLTGPLNMPDTGITLSSEQINRFAPPHNAAMMPDTSWDFDSLAGCGAIRT